MLTGSIFLGEKKQLNQNFNLLFCNKLPLRLTIWLIYYINNNQISNTGITVF